jgi:hypothetical protein
MLKPWSIHSPSGVKMEERAGGELAAKLAHQAVARRWVSDMTIGEM